MHLRKGDARELQRHAAVGGEVPWTSRRVSCQEQYDFQYCDLRVCLCSTCGLLRAPTRCQVSPSNQPERSRMNRWLLDDTAAATPPLAPHSPSRRGRCCGRATCASGGILLAASIGLTGCALNSLVYSIETTSRTQRMLVVECNATHGEVVTSHSTQCTGGDLQSAMAPWLRWLHTARPQPCYAPQW
jgi:hypothetical protein